MNADTTYYARIKFAQLVEKAYTETGEEIGYVLDKGTTIHRMVGYENFDVAKAGNHMFFSHKPDDVRTYAVFLKDFNNTGKRFDVSMEVAEKLVAPSDDTAKRYFQS